MPSRVWNLTVVIGGHHVFRIDILSRLRFIAETAQELLVVGKFRAQYLDGYFAIIDHIICEPHGGHATVSDDPLQTIISADEFLESIFSSDVFLTHILKSSGCLKHSSAN